VHMMRKKLVRAGTPSRFVRRCGGGLACQLRSLSTDKKSGGLYFSRPPSLHAAPARPYITTATLMGKQKGDTFRQSYWFRTGA